jgi:hypothetical protein
MVGANGVDLSQDENQHIKPQYSYAQMITQAILNAPDGKLNLNGIYNYIMNTYAYYRHQQAAGWQVSLIGLSYLLINCLLSPEFDQTQSLAQQILRQSCQVN